MIILLRKHIWQRVLLALTIILLLLGPVVFHELHTALAVEQAPTAVVIGPEIDHHGPP